MLLDRIEIVTPTDERVEFFSSLKGNAPRISAQGLVLVEGEKQLGALLRTTLPLVSLFMEERFYRLFSDALMRRDLSNVECFVASRAVMQEILGYRLHQGVFALAKRPASFEFANLPLPSVAFNGLSDPENIGTILRSAAAFGIKSCIYDDGSCDPLIRRSIRVSMGAALSTPVCHVEKLSQLIGQHRENPRFIAIENAPHAKPITDFLFQEKAVFILGNEQNGVSPELLEVCDDVVQISMESTTVSSLNVASAAAIVFAEFYRQRGRA